MALLQCNVESRSGCVIDDKKVSCFQAETHRPSVTTNDQLKRVEYWCSLLSHWREGQMGTLAQLTNWIPKIPLTTDLVGMVKTHFEFAVCSLFVRYRLICCEQIIKYLFPKIPLAVSVPYCMEFSFTVDANLLLKLILRACINITLHTESLNTFAGI